MKNVKSFCKTPYLTENEIKCYIDKAKSKLLYYPSIILNSIKTLLKDDIEIKAMKEEIEELEIYMTIYPNDISKKRIIELKNTIDYSYMINEIYNCLISCDLQSFYDNIESCKDIIDNLFDYIIVASKENIKAIYLSGDEIVI